MAPEPLTGPTLLVCATPMELAPFLDRHDTRAVDLPHATPVLKKLANAPVDILITGPGMANTLHGLTVYLCHASHRPGIIFDIGIAGAFERDGNSPGLGDIAIGSRSVYAHTGVTGSALPHQPLPFDLIPDQPSTRQGIYPANPALVDQWTQVFFQVGLPCHQGSILTVSTITGTPDAARELETAHSPVAEAMEGAGAAHIAALYQIPFLEVRSISNAVGERDKLKWDVPLACRTLAEAASCLIA